MLRLNSGTYFASFAFALIALGYPAHTDLATWEPSQPTTIGNDRVQPGRYQLKINEDLTDLEIMQGGKVIATTLCYWADLPQKAAATEVKVSNNRVTEVDFKGRSVAVLFF